MKKQNKATQTAQQAYEAAATDIGNLIDWLESELKDTPEKIDWGHVGSIQEVRNKLIEAVAFYSGSEIEMLRQIVEDARIN